MDNNYDYREVYKQSLSDAVMTIVEAILFLIIGIVMMAQADEVSLYDDDFFKGFLVAIIGIVIPSINNATRALFRSSDKRLSDIEKKLSKIETILQRKNSDSAGSDENSFGIYSLNKCKKCGAIMGEDAAFCGGCGAPANVGNIANGGNLINTGMNAGKSLCRNCGHEIKGMAPYCGNCGFSLVGNNKAGTKSGGNVGKCEGCKREAVVVTECEIRDEYGTRYRKLCDNCMRALQSINRV